MRVEIRGVEELSFRERQVVVLKESGLSGAEIAARLGIAEASVNTLLHRARRKGYEVVIVLPGSILGLMQDSGGETEDGTHEAGPVEP
ncbi:MAG: LuxR C-terminal-related transcriptional regulator [Firmicutes bacterium]|nr:LuxR C-terminal-related transcriptional regulator [Bacillota bacterium]